ncbi:MAG: hydrogenase expression/formation protein [Chloroflexi bacterium]|nr:hydrogenase expression/formation protein [Chloroflexota bacterium]
MQAGKLPHDLLARLLADIPHGDDRVVLGPGVGRDAAVIDNGGPSLLVAKSDPITFASDLIGWYAVHVNANDVACLGAKPAWFLATILLPEGATEELAETIFGQVKGACESLQIELVGGHTEVTLGIDRPIVIGSLLGEVSRERLVRPDGAKPGDALILTKGIAVEGTSVLARESQDRLTELGVDATSLTTAADYVYDPGISVITEARAACDAVQVHAMHDPTEGGLSTALYEMAEASNVGIAVDPGSIEVLPETKTLCSAASLDPLGLLASGSLLVAVAESEHRSALAAIRSIGVAAERIGTFVESETGVIMVGNTETDMPRFARDEVARFLADSGRSRGNQNPEGEA